MLDLQSKIFVFDFRDASATKINVYASKYSMHPTSYTWIYRRGMLDIVFNCGLLQYMYFNSKTTILQVTS